MKWRGILEMNRAVEAKTEAEAKQKLAATLEPDDWIVWEEPD